MPIRAAMTTTTNGTIKCGEPDESSLTETTDGFSLFIHSLSSKQPGGGQFKILSSRNMFQMHFSGEQLSLVSS